MAVGSPQTVTLPDGQRLAFRALAHDDVERLGRFLSGLSLETRSLSSFPGYDEEAAREICAAIGRFDKHRFVLVEEGGEAVALLELSLGIPDGDRARYRAAGIELHEGRDCRFGPTVADRWQGQGVAGAAFPLLLTQVRALGCSRLLLWGGVLERNERAIAFYRRRGFTLVGRFEQDGQSALDMLLDLDEHEGP